MNLLNNKFFILGILGLIIASIPLTIFFISQQQQVRTNAEAATTLSFTPGTITDAKVGDEIVLDVAVDPGGVNVVSIIRLQVKYDPAKLELINIEPANPPFSVTLEGLTASNGTASISFGIGSDVTQAVQAQTTAAKITFKALTTTEEPTLVSFETATAGQQTQVLSLSSTDNPGENVLSAANPASITILSGDDTSPSPIPSPIASASPTLVPTATPISNQAPVCNSLAADKTTIGTAPYSLTFTATGSDSDGTLSKVSYSFGDGAVQDVTDGSGIGTNAVSASQTHTYNTAGTYTVSATLTDDDSAVSTGATCSTTVTINADNSNGGNNGGNQTQPTPTIADPGSPATTIGIFAGIIVAIIGGVILFAL